MSTIIRKNFLDIKLDDIDIEKTTRNGKLICMQYRPLIEKRMKQKIASYVGTSNLSLTPKAPRSNNAREKWLLERCEWDSDQTSSFINLILELEQQDKFIGKYLKLKYIYDLTDKEIAEKIGMKYWTLVANKPSAYFYVAVWTNRVEFIYLLEFEFFYDSRIKNKMI